MITAGALWEELFSAMEAVDADKKIRIKRVLNLAYYDIIGKLSWEKCRRTKSLSFVGNPLWLPANMAGIDGIRDSDGNEYAFREAGQLSDLDDAKRRAYVSSVCQDPLVSQRGVSVDKDGTALTFSPVLSDDYTGEWITFAGQLGAYLLDGAATLDERWRGDNLDTVRFQIRPEGQKQLQLIDESGDELTADVTLDYWAFPTPLLDENQIILLPSTRALYVAALIRLKGLEQMDEMVADRYRGEYENAMRDMQDRNPAYQGPVFPGRLSTVRPGWASGGE